MPKTSPFRHLCEAAAEVRAAIYGNATGTAFEGHFGVPDSANCEKSIQAIARKYKRHGIDCDELASIIQSAKAARVDRNPSDSPAASIALRISLAIRDNVAGNPIRCQDAQDIVKSVVDAYRAGDSGFLSRIEEHLTGSRRKPRVIPKWQFTVIRWWCPRIRHFVSTESNQTSSGFWPGFAYFKPDAMLRYLWASDDKRISKDALRGFIRTRGLVRAKIPLVYIWPL